MITLTIEQAQQIEEALVKIADLRNLGKIQPEVIAFETLYVIRAARAQEQAEQSQLADASLEPVAWGIDWGKDSDQSCVSIIKKHPNGTSEVVAIEYSEHPVSQEPVAWMQIGIGDCEGTTILTARLPIEYNTEWWKFEPLYAAPVRTKDLTDDEICEIVDKLSRPHFIDFARAVIAADREKNK